MNVVEVSQLTKTFGHVKAVDDVSFSIAEGEILGLLGINGAGKTTIIQMMLGALTPTSGDIMYFGKSIHAHREEILERVSFSSTYTNLPWDLTVQENLTYLSYLYLFPEKKKRIARIAELFSLQELLHKPIHALSAGQLTRVNLAKAFLNFPHVLLLDEPTASLDPDIAHYVREFLLTQRKTFSVSILLTSHNMAEVEEVCDRVIFLNAGKIIANDTPEHLAQSIEISHVMLRIRDGMKRTLEYCTANTIPCHAAQRSLTVDLHERRIPEFLRALMDQGIIYDEISIEKPTLQDYFLQVAKKPTLSEINS